MKSKKGQSLPMNTIVIAAIVLIVLVVIVMIFTGSMGGFVKGLTKECVNDFDGTCGPFSCEGMGYKGGRGATEIPTGSIPITGTDCEEREDNSKYCCIIK